MRITYTASEARARFSEVMRQVREGNTIVVTYRGEPLAEIRPLQKRKLTQEEWDQEMERRGVLLPAKDPNASIKIGKHVSGALESFLAERGRSWES